LSTASFLTYSTDGLDTSGPSAGTFSTFISSSFLASTGFTGSTIWGGSAAFFSADWADTSGFLEMSF
jgi:hypothetical protein